jgi:2-C-methyl-D-erythritol 4-phosphate cytidylyltransferase/2-C-methyl-D-erythritol 2,4-cyclodiphosphate synthase
MSSEINVAILLAAGTSSRFTENEISKTPKQLFLLDNIPIIIYSLSILVNNPSINKVIVVINSAYQEELEKILSNNYILISKEKQLEKIIIVINNINCRLESIKTGINCINTSLKETVKNVIIHDSARPFIQNYHINKLLESMKENVYSQYYMKLVNGLLNIKTNQFVDRDDYVEICTPLCINNEIMQEIFHKYIDVENRKYYEFLPIIQQNKLNYNLIEGYHKFLKKITIKADIN